MENISIKQNNRSPYIDFIICVFRLLFTVYGFNSIDCLKKGIFECIHESDSDSTV